MNERGDWVFGDSEDMPRGTPAGKARAPGRPRQRGRKRRAFGRMVLFFTWFVFFAVGTACVFVVLSGFLRDGAFGDAEIPVALSRESGWRRALFRPWVPGAYWLYLTSDDGQERTDEHPFIGELLVKVETADGEVRLDEHYEAPNVEHRLRGGVEWTRLGLMHLNTPALEPWTISVRVVAADPAFAGIESSVLLRREKRIPGMSGLVNYAAAVPAVLFLALSVPAALALPRRGGTWMPALLSVV
jgi:hypothetical protein